MSSSKGTPRQSFPLLFRRPSLSSGSISRVKSTDSRRRLKHCRRVLEGRRGDSIPGQYHGLTEGNFPLNHPKNFLGYALALAADGDTEPFFAENVVDNPEGGRRGAIILGLIYARQDGEYLTHAGAEVVRFAQEQCGSISAALTEFDSWTRKRTRFTEHAPRWAQLAQSQTMQYEPTKLIVDALKSLHQVGTTAPMFPEGVKQACELNQSLVEVFFTQRRRDEVLSTDSELNESQQDDPGVVQVGSVLPV